MPFLRRALAVALITAGLVPATSAAQVSAAYGPQACAKLFTLAEFDRAATAAYSGTDLPPRGAYGHLWRYARCVRPPGTTAQALRLWRTRYGEWVARRHPPMNYSEVSWYNDAGTTASGWHATYGVADCGTDGVCYGFGTRIEFCYPVVYGESGRETATRCVVATVDDHGPYVHGRDFDLNQNTAAAIGFGGLGTVAWRVVG